MEKLYTQKEYQLQAEQANKDGLFLYQLVKEHEYTTEVLEYEKKIVSQDIYSEDGEIIGSQEVEVDDLTKPIMVEEEITNPETGKKETVIVQKHHTETRTKTVVELAIEPKGYYICFKDNYTNGEINPYYEDEKAKEREEQFNKDFFNTSLGYVRRKVSMATGETKDFLSDLLPTISMGIQMGQPVQIIAYDKPDFTQEIIDWEVFQNVKTVTAEFVQECFLQLSNDFKPVEVQDENTTNTTKSDIQDELDTTTSKSDETNSDILE